jgi:protein tyrosine phosphatase
VFEYVFPLQHVQRLHADGDIGFSKEYEAIQAASTTESLSAEHSHHPDNKQKNRYLNIVACELMSIHLTIVACEQLCAD